MCWDKTKTCNSFSLFQQKIFFNFSDWIEWYECLGTYFEIKRNSKKFSNNSRKCTCFILWIPIWPTKSTSSEVLRNMYFLKSLFVRIFLRFISYCLIRRSKNLNQNLNRNKKQPPEVFYEKSVLRNFAKFTVKHLCQRLFHQTFTKLTWPLLISL